MGDDVADQLALASLLLSSYNDCILHFRVTFQDRLDFARFDPKTTDLGLRIHTPHELDVAIGQVLDNVSGAIKPVGLVRSKRIGNEALASQFR